MTWTNSTTLSARRVNDTTFWNEKRAWAMVTSPKNIRFQAKLNSMPRPTRETTARTPTACQATFSMKRKTTSRSTLGQVASALRVARSYGTSLTP